MRRILATMAALALAIPPAPGDGPAVPLDVWKRVRDLGSDRWEVRLQAHRWLLQDDPRVLPALRGALASCDPEVRRRAAAILQVRPGGASKEEEPGFSCSRCSQPGTPEHGVSAGLKWLYRHQRGDGSWTGDGLLQRCPRGSCTDGTRPSNSPIELTGLSLLAFLGAGYTHQFGEHDGLQFKTAVWRGLQWLLKRQRPDGSFREDGAAWTRVNALATLALVEAWAMTSSPMLRERAFRAVGFLVESQGASGGWDHLLDGHVEAGATSWAALALRSASTGPDRLGGPRVERALERARAAIVRGESESAPEQRFLATLEAFRAGGETWRRWSRGLAWLVHAWHAERAGCSYGSWDPAGSAEGRLRTTALDVLTLQVYYRYPRCLAAGD